MAKRRTIHVDMILTHVEALSLRDVAGEGQQAELLIRTRTGTMVIRFVSRRGVALRLTDLRARDKKRRRGERFVSVPFTELVAPVTAQAR
jgi:hypothetical protein